MHKECLDGDNIFVIRHFLSAEECDSLIARGEAAGYDAATVTTSAGPIMVKELRDNARVILDDAALAETLWQRARPFVPATIPAWYVRHLGVPVWQRVQPLGSTSFREWNAVALNERFRFYRYDPGQKFGPHFDGYFERDTGERSHLTFMIYLNETFTGGKTKFYSDDRVPGVQVSPERGMALAFRHMQLHEGAAVVYGRKYVLRTDVIYALSGEAV